MAAAEVAAPRTVLVWGVAYRPVGMEADAHITHFGGGDLTEADARWMAERFQAENDHIAEAWAVSDDRRRFF